MSNYEVIYEVKLTKEQLTALKTHPRLGNAFEVVESFGGGDYNLGFFTLERDEEFETWCEENGVEAKLH